jgi:hypothetical protein
LRLVSADRYLASRHAFETPQFRPVSGSGFHRGSNRSEQRPVVRPLLAGVPGLVELVRVDVERREAAANPKGFPLLNDSVALASKTPDVDERRARRIVAHLNEREGTRVGYN